MSPNADPIVAELLGRRVAFTPGVALEEARSFFIQRANEDTRLVDAGMRAGRRVFILSPSPQDSQQALRELQESGRLGAVYAHFLLDDVAVVMEGACPTPTDKFAAELARDFCQTCGPCFAVDVDTEERLQV